MSLIERVIGTYSDRELKKIRPQVAAVIAQQERFRDMSEAELRGSTDQFRQRLGQGETLDDLLPEAFAASARPVRVLLGMTHFPVQIQVALSASGPYRRMRPARANTVATLPATSIYDG